MFQTEKCGIQTLSAPLVSNPTPTPRESHLFRQKSMVCHPTLLKVALHLSSYSLKGYLRINLQLKVTQQSRLLSVGL